LAGDYIVNLLAGTPFVCWYFRLLGSRIGQRVYLDTTDITEHDLVAIGDEAEINADATLQTHLFEDRVMKMGQVDIGARANVGSVSLVLYNTRMEPGSRLNDLSLLMKGETLPAETCWEGVPARASAIPPASLEK
jgi:non-ribosomal peptide synthetase-like protein